MPRNSAKSPAVSCCVQLVETDLGWMAIAGAAGRVQELTFGHATLEAAVGALGQFAQDFRVGTWLPGLSARLQRYARGQAEDLSDVPLAETTGTEFRRAVLCACREVPRGRTTSYAELARRCGRPRAARAVGNIMATNQTPLLIPCHRVLAASGGLGGYSAAGGLSTKVRLLQLEGAALPAGGRGPRTARDSPAVLTS